MTEFYNDLNTIPRSDLALYIHGNEEAAYFKTEKMGSNNNGVYEDRQLTKLTNINDGVKISTVSPGSSDKLILEGVSGKKTSGIDTAIKNDFTLMLKVKKSTN